MCRALLKNARAYAPKPLRAPPGSLGLEDVELVVPVLDRILVGAASLGVRVEGSEVIELGPGRTAHLAVGLAKAGARSVIGLDTDLKIGAEAASRAVRDLDGSSQPCAYEASVADRVSFLHFDGQHLPAKDGSIDLIYSKSVLEHVSGRLVEPLAHEMWRVLRPGGGCVHVIDLRDHMHIAGDDRVHGDWLDALRYPEWLFRAMFSGQSTYVNRLRSTEWRALFERCGFESHVWDERREELPSVFSVSRLRPRWRSLSEQELAVAWVTAEIMKPAATRETPGPDRSPRRSRGAA